MSFRDYGENVYSFANDMPFRTKVQTRPLEQNTKGYIKGSEFYYFLYKNIGMAEASCRSYVSAIRTAEKFAKEKGYYPNDLFDCNIAESIKLMDLLLKDSEFIKYNNKQHNRFNSAFSKFKEMIGKTEMNKADSDLLFCDQINKQPEDYDKEKFEETLLRRYRNGMQFDSIDFENFREMYEMIFEESLSFNDTELEERLRYCGVIYKERLFPAEGIIDQDTKKILFSYIDNCFCSGKTVLYYKALYEDLSDMLSHCFTLSDADMLREYIKYAAEKGKYYFFSNYMTKEKNVIIDHNAEVEEYFLNAGKPVATLDVCNALSHIPKEQVSRIITCDHRYQRNAKGEYFHVEISEISDLELEKISKIIGSMIEENEYAIWTDVWNEINETMPVLIENNVYLSGLGMRNVLGQKFRGRLNFEGAVICAPPHHYSMRDVYQLYAKHHDEFTVNDIYNLSKELDTVIYFDALAEVSVRVSHDLFVSKNLINFDVDEIDQVISSYMSKDYICIREIDSFLAFPNAGYEWNEYLLESYINSYSQKFLLMNNGFAMNNVAGAIVKKKSRISEFSDVCAAILADSGITLHKTEALNYLVEVNMITRRSYRDIESVIIKAKQLLKTKG